MGRADVFHLLSNASGNGTVIDFSVEEGEGGAVQESDTCELKTTSKRLKHALNGGHNF